MKQNQCPILWEKQIIVHIFDKNRKKINQKKNNKNHVFFKPGLFYFFFFFLTLAIGSKGLKGTDSAKIVKILIILFFAKDILSSLLFNLV